MNTILQSISNALIQDQGLFGSAVENIEPLKAKDMGCIPRRVFQLLFAAVTVANHRMTLNFFHKGHRFGMNATNVLIIQQAFYQIIAPRQEVRQTSPDQT